MTTVNCPLCDASIRYHPKRIYEMYHYRKQHKIKDKTIYPVLLSYTTIVLIKTKPHEINTAQYAKVILSHYATITNANECVVSEYEMGNNLK